MEIPERLAPDIVDGVEVPRPLRICDVCGQVDDHPRHLVGYLPDELVVNEDHIAAVIAVGGLSPEERATIVQDIIDTTTQFRHFDCCSQVGCPDGSCDVHSNDIIGQDLLDSIRSHAADNDDQEA
jgi:hypothetical protein